MEWLLGAHFVLLLLFIWKVFKDQLTCNSLSSGMLKLLYRNNCISADASTSRPAHIKAWVPAPLWLWQMLGDQRSQLPAPQSSFADWMGCSGLQPRGQHRPGVHVLGKGPSWCSPHANWLQHFAWSHIQPPVPPLTPSLFSALKPHVSLKVSDAFAMMQGQFSSLIYWLKSHSILLEESMLVWVILKHEQLFPSFSHK